MTLEALGLPVNASVDDVVARVRELASKYHPDKGGTEAQFQQLMKDKETALEEAKSPLLCDTCEGFGHVFVGGGFSRLRMPCPNCDGRGTIPKPRK